MAFIRVHTAQNTKTTYYVALVLCVVVYSDEGHRIVVETSVKSYCEHQLVGIEETLVAMSDCQPRIPLHDYAAIVAPPSSPVDTEMKGQQL